MRSLARRAATVLAATIAAAVSEPAIARAGCRDGLVYAPGVPWDAGCGGVYPVAGSAALVGAAVAVALGHAAYRYVQAGREIAAAAALPAPMAPPAAAPAPATYPAVDAVCDRLQIADPVKRQAVAHAYEVSRAHTAPFVVKVMNDMLAELHAAAVRNPRLTVVFLGRDGHSLAVAARYLDGEFYAARCKEIVLSRAVAEAAIQDLENNAGRSFPHIKDFRGAAGKVDPANIAGARRALTTYLHRAGVPAGVPGNEIALVDSSYKGTVQVLLSAIYPKSPFQGHYMFYAASPLDPQPGTKRGYALHLDAGESAGGRPVTDLPTDPARTFSHQDALATIEETLHGAWSSPKAFAASGVPDQYPLRLDERALDGINPVLIAGPYQDPVVREAVKAISLLPVAEYARYIAAQRASGVDVSAELHAGAERYVGQVRAWVAGSAAVDPQFKAVMDAFARRADKGLVKQLASAIASAGLDGAAARQTWLAYASMGPGLEQKASFVSQFRASQQNRTT